MKNAKNSDLRKIIGLWKVLDCLDKRVLWIYEIKETTESLCNFHFNATSLLKFDLIISKAAAVYFEFTTESMTA